MVHKVAIFDEFRNDWETLSVFLRITHEYPATVNCKYGNVFFNPEIVIFTCPDRAAQRKGSSVLHGKRRTLGTP